MEYLFTFSGNHLKAGYCQPIFAEDYGKARMKMFDLFGDNWGFQYSRAEWDRMKNDPTRRWEMEIELPAIKEDD